MKTRTVAIDYVEMMTGLFDDKLLKFSEPKQAKK